MDYFKRMGVYSKVPQEEVRKHGAKVITTKWVDTNKGSEVEPNYRSRLVGRELNLSGRPDLFAAPPPLEAIKMVVSAVAAGICDDTVVAAIDVRRAYDYDHYYARRGATCKPSSHPKTGNQVTRACAASLSRPCVARGTRRSAGRRSTSAL